MDLGKYVAYIKAIKHVRVKGVEIEEICNDGMRRAAPVWKSRRSTIVMLLEHISLLSIRSSGDERAGFM